MAAMYWLSRAVTVKLPVSRSLVMLSTTGAVSSTVRVVVRKEPSFRLPELFRARMSSRVMAFWPV